MSDQCHDIVDRTVRSVADADHLTEVLGPTRAATLHDGLAGTALALAVLAGQDPALARIASRHWDAAARLAKGTPPDGVYRGPGALAASLILGNGYLPAGHRRPHDVDRATAWLSARACGLARHQAARIRQGRRGTAWAVYDSMRGLAGIGRILLAAAHSGHRKTAEPGLDAALSTLTEMINQPAEPYPAWGQPDDQLHGPTAAPVSGTATTGLAHGIAGPLAFLAIAARYGDSVPGQSDAVFSASAWLLTWRTGEGNWPAHIAGDALLSPASHPPQSPTRRDAWCYGNAGIGNALIHGGTSTGYGAITNCGHDALRVIARHPAQRWDTTGPGICHGTAGVMLAAGAHGYAPLQRRAQDATAAQLTTTEAHDTDPGLLTGSTGAALALGASSRPRDGAAWTALFLLT